MYCLLYIHKCNTSDMAAVDVGIVSRWTADTIFPKTAEWWKQYTFPSNGKIQQY